MPPQEKDEERNHLVAGISTSNEEAQQPSATTANENNMNTTKQQKEREPNPYLSASFISKLLFMWPFPLLKKGMEKPLEEQDLPHIMETESSEYNRIYFENIWNKEQRRVADLNHKRRLKGKQPIQPKLHRAIFIDFFKSTWYIQPIMFLSATARIVMSIALGKMTQAFIDKSASDAYFWAGTMVFCNLIVLLEHHHVFFVTSRKGMNLRTGSVAAIFAKTLRLSAISGGGGGGSSSGNSTSGSSKNSSSEKKSKSLVAKENISSGQIMNLVSNDVERYWVTALFIAYIIWAPLQTIAILVLGLMMIGPAFAIGMGVLIFFFVPLQVYLSKRFASVRSKVASITDSRVTLVSQAINGVRVMKMSGWEDQFKQRIDRLRTNEIKQIQKSYTLYAINEALFFSSTTVISILIFAVHVLMGGKLSTDVVFTIIAFMTVLQIELTKHLSLAIMAGAECKVSIRRIQNFLEIPELPMTQQIKATDSSDDSALSFNNFTCKWDFTHHDTSNGEAGDSEHGTIALDGINVDLRMNELTFVIGPVGSGKSAFLYAAAGELVEQSGSITRSQKSIAFAPQEPWIMNGSVKENITMGLPFDADFYQQVVEACGLNIDFKQFANGDKTLVGDRGVQCSGGQRARIGLARALYRNTDILLLDDPLSAVDSKVGALIFYSAIKGLALKRGACVVLVTHQHQFIGESRCLFMNDGKVLVDGTFADCVSSSGGHLDFVSQNAGEVVESNKNKDDKAKQSKIPDQSTIQQGDKKCDEVEKDSDSTDDQQEKKEDGLVSRATFALYANSMGGFWVAIWLFVLFVLSTAASLAAVAMIGRWSERTLEEQRSLDIILIVVSLGVGVVLLSFYRSIAFLKQSLIASKSLHDSMTAAVLRAKIEFFDTNPSGRILNRFSADVGSNDELLPKTFFDFMVCAFLVVGSLVTAVTALPYILLIVPPLVWYFLRTRVVFVTSSREIKRYEGLARSPIFAMLSESISGIATIRSNNALEYIENKFEMVHDSHCRAFFSFVMASRWVGFRMDSLMFLTVSFASILAALFSDRGWFDVDPVIFGLALSMLIQLGSIFQWTIRQSAEVVNQMVCVERVSEYSKLAAEAPLTNDVDKSLGTWPNSGSIQVEKLSTRYRSILPLSLNGVSFNIESGQKVGVVGRTGSGKSTLVQSLFRILENESGTIFIDGVDVSKLGLHKLRMSMSVINQVPVLFSGCTIRENLDPFGHYSDEAVTNSLEDVQMLDAINNLPDGLNSYVAENGSNFSVGERQLLCLARATLQRSRILVLDEPTANVDLRTDQLLQEAVRKSFVGSTIISVAHRLDTIIDSDVILVLGRGKVLEFGSPKELIEKNSHFASMVQDTGDEMSQELRRRAFLSADK